MIWLIIIIDRIVKYAELCIGVCRNWADLIWVWEISGICGLVQCYRRSRYFTYTRAHTQKKKIPPPKPSDKTVITICNGHQSIECELLRFSALSSLKANLWKHINIFPRKKQSLHYGNWTKYKKKEQQQ